MVVVAAWSILLMTPIFMMSLHIAPLVVVIMTIVTMFPQMNHVAWCASEAPQVSPIHHYCCPLPLSNPDTDVSLPRLGNVSRPILALLSTSH